MKFTCIVFIGILFAYLNTSDIVNLTPNQNKDAVVCNTNGCKGTYIGPEFINGSDVAHQLSNTISWKVGDMLKENYRQGIFSKVDFFRIEMSTKGMSSGNVTYKVYIPFTKVKEKCDAFTSFDHVGGWNHSPALKSRKSQLSRLLMEGEALDISNLKTTPEGLQEYWIQWKHKDVQSDCKPQH